VFATSGLVFISFGGLTKVASIAEEVKVPFTLPFKPLKTSLEQPFLRDYMNRPLEMFNPDSNKFGRPEQLHVIHNALLSFVEEHKSLPELNNQDHAKELYEMAVQFNKTEMEIEGRV